MQFNSLELWDSIELELIELKNREDLDEILVQRFDSLVNNFNGNMANRYQFETIQKIETLISVLDSVTFYKIRQIDKKDVERLKALSENLSILAKVLRQEKKDFEEEPIVKRERLKNINNDKSLKIFDEVENGRRRIITK